MPGGGSAVRGPGATAALPGGLPDRGLAGVVPLPVGAELPGDDLRGGVRAGGVEGGVRGGAPGAAADSGAEAPGDDPAGGATGGLRQPGARRRAGTANAVAGPAEAS